MKVEAVRKLPWTEKMRLMKTLWDELSRPDYEFEFPAWHAKELESADREFRAERSRCYAVAVSGISRNTISFSALTGRMA
jgi:hypothetical protein